MIALQGAIRFNGGGHINHSLFWKNLAPASAGGGGAPEGELAKRIDAEFGDSESFKAKFNAQTAAVQGSGWGWLVYHPEKGTVAIHTTQNQDPVSMSGLVPSLAWTCASTPTTSTTRTLVPSTSRTSGRSWTWARWLPALTRRAREPVACSA